ncbi:MAG: YbjN domain-containing protein [Tsuneonella sp.]
MKLLCPLAALLLAVPASLSAAEYQPDRVVAAVNLDDLKQVVAALGDKLEGEDAGDHTLRAVTRGGASYLLTGSACDIEGVPGCRGVVMQVLVSADGDVSAERLAQANLDQVAVSTRYYPDKGAISVTRYLVLDGGVTMANVAQNIGVLLALTPEVMRIVAGK